MGEINILLNKAYSSTAAVLHINKGYIIVLNIKSQILSEKIKHKNLFTA
jgi:hypothetical protein